MSQKLIEEYHPIVYDVYHVKAAKHIREDITVYDDDSLQEIYYKISSVENVPPEYIHLWYFNENKNYSLLGYKYEEIESLKDLYSLGEKDYIKECIDEEGLQTITVKNYDIHKTLENIYLDKNRLFYTTLQDYLSSSDIKTIDKENWTLSLDYLQFINGKIRVYWPELTESTIIERKNKSLTKRVKRISKIVKNTDDILKKIYSHRETLKPQDIYMNTLIFDNKSDGDNSVNIAQLFADIKLTKYKDYILLFSKIMMESYDESHYKVLKGVIKDKNYPDNPLSERDFIRLTKGTVISTANLKVRYLDIRRSVSLIFYKDNIFIQLNINDNGEIKLIIPSFIVDKIDHMGIIKDMNSYVGDKIISQKVYFGIDDSVKYITENVNETLKTPINLMNYDLIYDIKNFDLKVLEKMIVNLSVFFRIENAGDSKIHIIYKRVNEYNSVAGKLRMISKVVNETDKRDEIINRISDIFNILEEDAIENYEIWKQMSQKGYKNVQEGIDIIIEGFKSSHIRVITGGCTSKREMVRINHVINTLMGCYLNYIENKKDNLSLMKKKKMDEDLLDFSDDDEIISGATENPIPTPVLDGEEPNEDSESSDDFEMGLLDDLDSDEDSSSGGAMTPRMTGGGYDLRSYYLNRLSKNSKYDNELFKFTTGKVHTSKKGVLKETYARACSANYSRHPVALTEKELNEIKDNPDYGAGIGYSNAIKIEGRPKTINGDTYYICPKYWDMKNETPLDPLKLDEFRENVFGMDYSKNPSGEPIKMLAKDKANSDKYILVRSGYHWTNAGDDIMRYKVDTMKNVHPDGYDVPCCNVERQEKISMSDKVDWFDEKNNKWIRGTCVRRGSDKDESKPYIIKIEGLGEIKTARKHIKKYKENNHISNSIPCNEGKYCHVNEDLKKYVGQHVDMPKKGESENGIYRLGLVRKGIKRTDDSLLITLCALFDKKNTETLISHIITDLQKCDNLFKIANGTFVNTFYSELKDINDNEVRDFIKELVKQKGVTKRHRDVLSKDNFKVVNLRRGTPHMVSLNNHYYRSFSSIINFEKYLNDITDKDDKILIPVLCSIMKMDGNTTFGERRIDTNIMVLEEVANEIRILEPMGGFIKDFDKLYLIYKYRDNYEPIYMNIFEEYVAIIDPYNILPKYEDTIDSKYRINERFESIQDFFKNIVESLKILLIDEKRKEYKQLPGALEIVEILAQKELPVISQVYDDYGFIRYIETASDCLVPVRPTYVEEFCRVKVAARVVRQASDAAAKLRHTSAMAWAVKASKKAHLRAVEGERLEKEKKLPSLLVNLKYLALFKRRPTYKSVIDILNKVDEGVNKEIRLGYLDDMHVNVIDYYEKVPIKGTETKEKKTISKHGLHIKEIVINQTSFIPIEKTSYQKRFHPEILYKGELQEIDIYLSTGGEMVDEMKTTLLNKSYKQYLHNYLSRKIYISYLTTKSLQAEIKGIKSMGYMRNYHKIKRVYTELDRFVVKYCAFKDEEYDDSLDMVKNEKVNVYHVGEISNKIIYYKTLMNIASLFINYSHDEYGRLVGAYINEEMLEKSITDDELYFSYNDIELDEYKYLFSDRSIFIRKTNIYNDRLTTEQYERIRKIKQQDAVVVEFEKKYPKMINEYIHKNSLVLKYGNESRYEIIQKGLEEAETRTGEELKKIVEGLIEKNETRGWIQDEKDMSVIELFREFLGEKIDDTEDIKNFLEKEKGLTIFEAYLLSHILKRGINMIVYNKDNTIELKIIITPESFLKLDESEMFTLIQTSSYLGNISIRNELIFPLDSYSEKYYSVLRKQHRGVYDILQEIKKKKAEARRKKAEAKKTT